MWSCFLSRLKEIRANPCGSFERWTSWAHLPGLWKSWAADGRRSCGHWALFEVTVLEGHPVGRAGWRTLQLPLSQVMFSIGLGVRDGCWPHSGGLCLAGVEMQRDNTTVEQGKESFVSRWSLLMFHSLSALGPERSQVTFWEPLRSGAPAEQPRESPYNWGTAWATSLLWPSSQGQPAWWALLPGEGASFPACLCSAVLVLSVAGVGLAPSVP